MPTRKETDQQKHGAPFLGLQVPISLGFTAISLSLHRMRRQAKNNKHEMRRYIYINCKRSDPTQGQITNYSNNVISNF